jgi:hypothetical protein
MLAASEIADRLARYGIPGLSALRDLDALRALWASGRSPGLMERQRREMLRQMAEEFDE